MKKQLIYGLGGLLIGGAVMTGISVSAHQSPDGSFKAGRGQHKAVVAEVLDLEEAELEQAREDDKTIEDLYTEAGLSQQEFEQQVEDALVELWEADGLSEEEITERLENKEQRQTVREARRTVVAEVLGLDESELANLRGASHDEREAQQKAAGYDNQEAFHNALQQGLTEQLVEDGFSQAEAEELASKAPRRGHRHGSR